MSDLTRHELQVDMLRCDAYGYCAELLPGIVEVDEWGYPVVAGTISPLRLEDAQRAVSACPKLALRLRAMNARSPAGRAKVSS